MKTALVTGANGKIGQILIPELLRQNFKVKLFLRYKKSKECKKNLSDFIYNLELKKLHYSNIEICYGDIVDYNSVLSAASGVDYIFHLAALLHINNPDPSMYGKFYDVNVIGTKNVVDAAIKAGVKRVILFSTISVYGVGSADQIFYESSHVNPLTIYAKTKFLAEKHISSCVTILRLASVYGSHVTGNYLRLVQAVKKGFFCVPVNKSGFSVYRTLIHENDVAKGAIIAATHPDSAGRVYNLTDGEIYLLEDIIKAIANALSVNIKILKIPNKPLEFISDFFCSYKSKNIKNIAIIMNKLMENIAVDGQKIQTELGFTPKYNLENGWYHALSQLPLP